MRSISEVSGKQVPWGNDHRLVEWPKKLLPDTQHSGVCFFWQGVYAVGGYVGSDSLARDGLSRPILIHIRAWFGMEKALVILTFWGKRPMNVTVGVYSCLFSCTFWPWYATGVDGRVGPGGNCASVITVLTWVARSWGAAAQFCGFHILGSHRDPSCPPCYLMYT